MTLYQTETNSNLILFSNQNYSDDDASKSLVGNNLLQKTSSPAFRRHLKSMALAFWPVKCVKWCFEIRIWQDSPDSDWKCWVRLIHVMSTGHWMLKLVLKIELLFSFWFLAAIKIIFKRSTDHSNTFLYLFLVKSPLELEGVSKYKTQQQFKKEKNNSILDTNFKNQQPLEMSWFTYKTIFFFLT